MITETAGDGYGTVAQPPGAVDGSGYAGLDRPTALSLFQPSTLIHQPTSYSWPAVTFSMRQSGVKNCTRMTTLLKIQQRALLLIAKRTQFSQKQLSVEDLINTDVG